MSTLNINNDYIHLNSASSDKVVVEGSLGIGTTSPSAKLHIVEGNNYVKIGDLNGLSTAVIELSDSSPVQIEGYSSDLTFRTNSQRRMTVTNSGDVGIDTTSPSQKLHVVGGNSNQLLLENSTSTGSARIQFKANSNRDAGPFIASTQRGGASGDSDLRLGDENGTTLTINAGNVGIGTISPTGGKLHVVSTGDELVRLEHGNAAGNPYISFIQSGTRRSYIQLLDSENNLRLASEYGIVSFLTGDANNETERMRIDSSGNVGIGTTSPAEKLHVAGTARFTDSVRIDTTGTALEITGTTTVDSSDVSIYLGNSPSSYGFYITYVGSGGGNTNAFRINSTNAGTPKTLLISNQDGIVNFPTGLQLNGAGVATQSWVSSQSYATQSYVNTAVSNLVDSAPSTLDTLNELAAALGDDPNFATTVTNSIATKLPLAGGTMTGTLKLNSELQFFRGGSSDYSNYIRANNYPSEGYTTSTAKYWLEYGAKGGHHFVVNTDGGSGAALNDYDDFTIWQGAIDGDRLFEVRNNGDVQIPSGSLTVSGTVTGSNLNVSNWDTAYSWGNHSGQYLPINGGTVGGAVTINGALVVNGTITENSSLRVKENIITSDGHLEKVNKLRPVKYNKINSDKTEIGLIAEEVEEVYPEFIQYDENGDPIGIHYSRLTASLIGAVKELTKEVEELKNKING